ncbi:hypothetical protein OV203_01470 [Nannocystis sp. ILAH1]|uniref:hypothetical protein n=1 Tax=Nannocystis sp. ILAH1 TaxID=2996789 RepID=UPI0022719866|nr:hypothetical protein [Nannocystis sp. ILAH1]MCY0985780.1 hypothetical protein [Nannocystis sp. ILAH1]
MLADLAIRTPSVGALGTGTLASGLSLRRLIDFVADQLPRWRGHPERPPAESEIHLNDQLCSYLNGAARRSALDAIQFCAESPDESHRGRRLDLAVRPCGSTLRIEGRRYSEFETILPIECKRLPTPHDDARRGEREYVISAEDKTTGGIQRFKLGLHGAAHPLAVLIGYIQGGTPEHWRSTINGWLAEVASSDALWRDEQLNPLASDAAVARFISVHRRDAASTVTIELQHLWIDMRGAP